MTHLGHAHSSGHPEEESPRALPRRAAILGIRLVNIRDGAVDLVDGCERVQHRVEGVRVHRQTKLSHRWRHREGDADVAVAQFGRLVALSSPARDKELRKVFGVRVDVRVEEAGEDALCARHVRSRGGYSKEAEVRVGVRCMPLA